MTAPVVLTSFGHIGAYGPVAQRAHGSGGALRQALADGIGTASEVDRSGGWHRSPSARHGFLVSEPLDDWLDPRKARRLSQASRFAVAASQITIEASAVASLEEAGAASVHMATALGPASSTETLLDQIFREGPESASPLHFMESVANAPAAQVAMALSAHGPNSSVTQREAGGLLSICDGWCDVSRGRTQRAIVGMVDELTPLNHAIFDRYRALARSGAAREEASRPFDPTRDGFIMGEGATAWLLENETTAVARGASILGRISAVARGHDPSAPAWNWGSGAELLARRVRSELERQRIDLESIDVWVASANGSRAGDALEAELLRHLFERSARFPRIAVPKMVTGEFGGGHLAGSALIVEGADFSGVDRTDLVADTLGVEAARVAAPGTSPRRVVLSTLAAGGAAAWVVVDPA